MTKHTLVIIILFLWLLSSCADNEDQCPDGLTIPCLCTKEYDPVCGCNNKTYGNPCLATCSGMNDFTKGECP